MPFAAVRRRPHAKTPHRGPCGRSSQPGGQLAGVRPRGVAEEGVTQRPATQDLHTGQPVTNHRAGDFIPLIGPSFPYAYNPRRLWKCGHTANDRQVLLYLN